MATQETLDVNIQQVDSLISPSGLRDEIPNSSIATKTVLEERRETLAKGGYQCRQPIQQVSYDDVLFLIWCTSNMRFC